MKSRERTGVLISIVSVLRCASPLFQQRPVENEVELEIESSEKNAEHFAHKAIVGRLVELERATVIEVLGELERIAATQHFHRCCQLFLADLLVLLPLVRSTKTLSKQEQMRKHIYVSDVLSCNETQECG